MSPGHVTRFLLPYGTGEIDCLNRLNVIPIRSVVQWHFVFASFFPFLYDMEESSRPILRCLIFSSIFSSLFLNSYSISRLFLIWFFPFFKQWFFLWFFKVLLKTQVSLEKIGNLKSKDIVEAVASHGRQNCLAHTGPNHGNHVREWHIRVELESRDCQLEKEENFFENSAVSERFWWKCIVKLIYSNTKSNGFLKLTGCAKHIVVRILPRSKTKISVWKNSVKKFFFLFNSKNEPRAKFFHYFGAKFCKSSNRRDL